MSVHLLGYLFDPESPAVTAEQARLRMRMVREAGGVPVLAHAFAIRCGPVLEPAVIVELAAVGRGGLEVDHPDHDPAARSPQARP